MQKHNEEIKVEEVPLNAKPKKYPMHLKLQSLCNEKNVFQKYKKGWLFDETKMSMLDKIREGQKYSGGQIFTRKRKTSKSSDFSVLFQFWYSVKLFLSFEGFNKKS